MSESQVRAEASPDEQLIMLRGLTQRTNVLHEAQVDQLRKWGRASMACLYAKEDIEDIQFAVGLHDDEKTKKKLRLVEYRVTGRDKRLLNATQFKRLMAALVRSVRWLLGDEFTVVVKVNGTAIFSTEPARGRSSRDSTATTTSNRPSPRANGRNRNRRR